MFLFGTLLVAGLIGELAKTPKWKARLRTFELMVIWGVSGELVGDGGIFVFSERLQAISDAEVANLNKEAADVRKEAASLLTKLVQQGSRSELLKAKREQVIDALRPFSGQKYEVRYCARYANDFDVEQLIFGIAYSLQEAKWLRPGNQFIALDCEGSDFGILLRNTFSLTHRRRRDEVEAKFASVIAKS